MKLLLVSLACFAIVVADTNDPQRRRSISTGANADPLDSCSSPGPECRCGWFSCPRFCVHRCAQLCKGDVVCEPELRACRFDKLKAYCGEPLNSDPASTASLAAITPASTFKAASTTAAAAKRPPAAFNLAAAPGQPQAEDTSSSASRAETVTLTQSAPGIKADKTTTVKPRRKYRRTTTTTTPRPVRSTTAAPQPTPVKTETDSSRNEGYSNASPASPTASASTTSSSLLVTSSTPKPRPSVTTEGPKKVVPKTTLAPFSYNQAIRKFTQNLFVEVSKDQTANFVFSPLSLHIALSMLARGATDLSVTKKELFRVLGYSTRALLTETEEVYSNIIDNYQRNDSSVLTLANSLWVKDQVLPRIKPSFINLLNSTYRALIQPLSNKNPEAGVNAWVREATDAKIEKIINSVSSDAALLLTNAVHFREAWDVAFDELKDPVDFHLTNGQVVKARMMSRNSYEIGMATFRFTKVLPDMRMSLVSLKYSNDFGRFQMVIVMPEKVDGLDQIVKYLSSARGADREEIFLTIQDAAAEAEKETSERFLTMPMFSVRSELQIEDYLKKLGVSKAFSVGEFDNIASDVRLKLSSVSHVASIDVTVDGTVGAAATGVEVSLYSLSFELPLNTTIDKPFLFLIKDTLHDTLIFVGKVSRPEILDQEDEADQRG